MTCAPSTREPQGGGACVSTPLVTNTEFATNSEQNVPHVNGADRKKRLLLQSVAKDVLRTNHKPTFVDFDQRPTHVKEGKGRSATYRLANENEIARFHQVETFEGFKYIQNRRRHAGKKIQFFMMVEDHTQYFEESLYQGACGNYYRKAHEAENGRYYRVMPDFYRLGACCQVSTIFRPDSISGEMRKQDYRDAAEMVAVASIGARDTENGAEARLLGLMKCKNRWVCPCCSPYLSSYENSRVRSALYQHYISGGYVLFLTWTLAHNLGSDCLDTVNALKAGVRAAKTGGSATRFKKKYGYVGGFSSTEYTYTLNNGHHPHIHEIMFLTEEFDPRELKGLKADLSNRYREALKKMGAYANSKRGLDVRLALSSNQEKQLYSDATGSVDLNDLEQLASYITKGLDCDGSHDDIVQDKSQWTVAEEVTMGHLKSCKVKKTKGGKKIVSFTATGLLEQIYYLSTLIKNECDEEKKSFLISEIGRYRYIYTQYAKAFQGTSQMRFTPGAADHFNLEEKIDDNEVLNAVDAAFDNPVIDLSVDDLRVISSHRLRSPILDFVESAMQGDGPFQDRLSRATKAVRKYLDYYRKRDVESFSYG